MKPTAAILASLPSGLTQHAYEGSRGNPTKPRLTTRTVTKALRARGIDGELVQGNGYLYFSGPAFETCFGTSVAVCWLNDLSLDGWLSEARMILRNA